jgi:hypothetical protein
MAVMMTMVMAPVPVPVHLLRNRIQPAALPITSPSAGVARVGDELDKAMPNATVAGIQIFRILFSLVQIVGRGRARLRHAK